MESKDNIIRYGANLCLLIGQGLLLYDNQIIGIIIKLIGGLVLIRYMVSYKFWDMVVVLTAFQLLDLSKLLSLSLD